MNDLWKFTRSWICELPEYKQEAAEKAERLLMSDLKNAGLTCSGVKHTLLWSVPGESRGRVEPLDVAAIREAKEALKATSIPVETTPTEGT